jgi:hypothetical protein
MRWTPGSGKLAGGVCRNLMGHSTVAIRLSTEPSINLSATPRHISRRSSAYAVKDKVRQILKTSSSQSRGLVIQWLNPVIRGWASYYRHVVSQKVFDDIDSAIWRLTWNWATRRHPWKSRAWNQGLLLCVQGRSRLGVHRRIGDVISDEHARDPASCQNPPRCQPLRPTARRLFNRASPAETGEDTNSGTDMAHPVSRPSHHFVECRALCGAFSRL